MSLSAQSLDYTLNLTNEGGKAISNATIFVEIGRTNDNGTTYINAQHLYLVLGMINNDFITMQKGNGIYKLKEDLRVNYGWNDESTAKEKSDKNPHCVEALVLFLHSIENNGT